MQRYNPKDIEPKWQKIWEDSKIYQASEDKSKPKKYVLEYFPYPSGAAMHVGHVRNYTIGDAVARFNRMQGNNVLHPMGWDAFGLPAENYAIKTGTSPRQAIDENTKRFKQQLTQMGFSYDWSREIDSTDPKYYRWTQWFFLLLFKKGLAYQQESLQWWCPHDKTVLANEQVENGRCWRCGNVVEKKALKQWFFKITAYADRLDADLQDLNWSDAIKSMQHNWIGRSKGAEIDFEVEADLEGQDFVFLHGFTGTNEKDFWPWLKQEIEGRGGKVYAPNLPNTAEPNVEKQATYVLDNYAFTENTHIVAHSLGSAVALKLLPQLSVRVAELILVAPALDTVYADGKSRPNLDKASDWKFDYRAAASKVETITVLGDKNDHIILQEKFLKTAKSLHGRCVVVVSNKSHFNGEKEEAVLQAITPKIKVFTTRPDTLFGATFMVLAPEHPLVEKITTDKQKQHVTTYVKAAQAKSDVERQETDREKTGVFTGTYAVNPATGKRIPVWVADYVLYGYGTGAIMAVPAHDERDYEFAQKFALPIVEVIEKPTDTEGCYAGEGSVVHSGTYDGMASSEMRDKIVADLAKKGVAEEKVNYKMRDWLISRQRYWGAPIPIVHCPTDGVVPVPEDQLPVKLPELKKFEPSGDGRSPLANVPEWVNTTCPKCGGKAQRETDTMDGFACSSWYFLRFADPHNDDRPFDKSKVDFWLPVDDYIGGAEHAVMHLLYARFWTKVMHDEGLIDFDEPFTTLRNHGMILAPDGQKMSKSKGNTIEPDGLIEQGYGADAVRIMELFVGPWNQAANWSVEGMGGAFRFLQRAWTLTQEFLAEAEAAKGESSTELLRAVHKATKRVSEDLENMGFNTAIAAQMELVNELFRLKAADQYAAKEWRWALETLLQLLAPFAPHIAEELWHELGHEDSIHVSKWPVWDEKYLVEDVVTIAVQVNGKLRGEVQVPADASEETVVAAAKENSKVKVHISGKKIVKIIYVPGKLVSLVVA